MYKIININKNSIFEYKKPYIIQNTNTKKVSHGVKTKEEAENIIKALYKYMR